MIQPIILSGGSGKRLWPLSRFHYPKQLLAFNDELTMLQKTITRVKNASPAIIVCNEEHRFLVAEQIASMKAPKSQILLEPMAKNTLPAITVGAFKAMQDGNDPVLLVMPADHFIDNESEFLKAVKLAEKIAQKEERLVTFGVKPSYAHTGYGYIEAGNNFDKNTYAVSAFHEKPDEKQATIYFSKTNYYWNSGIFVFKASTFLNEVKNFEPEVYQAAKESLSMARKDLDFIRLDKKCFESSPSQSVDYGIMEKTKKAVVIPVSFKWSDIGSFDTLWDVSNKDQQGNALFGDVLVAASQNNLVYSTSRLVSLVGVEDMVVVETSDAIMLAPRKNSQDIKEIVKQLEDNNREEHLYHKVIYRPWGSYESINQGNRFQVKLISVKPGAKLSLQKHYHRSEHWVVVKGTAIVTRDDSVTTLTENQSVYLPLGCVHRLENPGKVKLELIEVQTGTYLGEDDIERIEDDFGRI